MGSNLITTNIGNKPSLNDKVKPLDLTPFKNASHVIVLQCVNTDGNEKQAMFFFNGKEAWFDHFYRNTDDNAMVANGGIMGRTDSILASIRGLMDRDKSIQSWKATAYDLANPDTPFCNWCIVHKDKENRFDN